MNCEMRKLKKIKCGDEGDMKKNIKKWEYSDS